MSSLILYSHELLISFIFLLFFFLVFANIFVSKKTVTLTMIQTSGFHEIMMWFIVKAVFKYCKAI